MVSENYFSVLGIAPLRGRIFAEEDRKQLADAPAVLISENYWQKRFGGDPEIIGRGDPTEWCCGDDHRDHSS